MYSSVVEILGAWVGVVYYSGGGGGGGGHTRTHTFYVPACCLIESKMNDIVFVIAILTS